MANKFSDEIRKEFESNLAENLPVLRAKLGITQQELANRIGISRNMLACIEIKKKAMSWITFVALSLLFLKNEQTASVFKSLNIYTKELDDYLMFNTPDDL